LKIVVPHENISRKFQENLEDTPRIYQHNIFSLLKKLLSQHSN